jgi:hypothetical protein
MWPRPHPRPPLSLSRLRDIGWSLWDPIGLLAPGEAWDGKPFADEYDAYLTATAPMLRDGRSEGECVDYLTWVAVVHMALGLDRDGAVIPGREAAARASAFVVVEAIRAHAERLDAPPVRH